MLELLHATTKHCFILLKTQQKVFKEKATFKIEAQFNPTKEKIFMSNILTFVRLMKKN